MEEELKILFKKKLFFYQYFSLIIVEPPVRPLGNKNRLSELGLYRVTSQLESTQLLQVISWLGNVGTDQWSQSRLCPQTRLQETSG